MFVLYLDFVLLLIIEIAEYVACKIVNEQQTIFLYFTRCTFLVNVL